MVKVNPLWALKGKNIYIQTCFNFRFQNKTFQR